MPGFVTHHIFGVELMKKLADTEEGKLMERWKGPWLLGLQGPDIFFYNLTLMRYKDYRNIGSFMHENEMNRFFQVGLSLIEKKRGERERQICKAYLMGFFCHYMLDRECHPFIYARTDFQVGRKEKDYYGRHAKLENAIDSYMLEKYNGQRLTAFSQGDIFKLEKEEKDILSHFISECVFFTLRHYFKKTRFSLTPAVVRFTLQCGRVESKLLVDRSGRKTKVVKFVENRAIKGEVLTHRMIRDKEENMRECLNLKHDVWKNPWDPSRKSRDSLLDLYRKAYEKCLHLLPQIDEEDFCQKIGNYSYHSGLREEK